MRARRTTSLGFTLIEILVVIVITIIMIGLVLGPVAQTFNLTSRAQKQIEAQDTARVVLERISRELAEAVFVYDNSEQMIAVQNQSGNWTDAGGNPILVRYAVIDFVPPKFIAHCNSPADDPDHPHPTDEPRDFPPGEEASPVCPICESGNVELRPAEPLQPSAKIVRYFIAKRFPSLDYSSPFATGLVAGTGVDNPYVLYRAEFDPWDENLIRRDENNQPILQDPEFFYNPSTNNPWWKISRIVGPAKDIDLMVWGNGGAVPRPLVTFTPTVELNDALTPTYLSDIDAEVPWAIPTVFRGGFGMWTPNYTVRVFRDNFQTEFHTAYNSSGHMCVFDPDGEEVFDITQYQTTGAFSPADKLDLMLSVDTKNGEVTFAMPGEREEFDTDDLNGSFLVGFTANGVGERTVTLNPGIPNARIIPGSEEVVAPDATAGLNYGKPVRYVRVPFAISDPGRNQYKINYDTGEIWFSSRYDEPLPPGTENIRVSYKFHNNLPGDIVRADYVTKNLITISMQIRMYDPASGKSQAMELANKVRINNTVR